MWYNKRQSRLGLQGVGAASRLVVDVGTFVVYQLVYSLKARSRGSSGFRGRLLQWPGSGRSGGDACAGDAYGQGGEVEG